MPFYELFLIVRPTPKKDLLDCLKRTATLIWNERGVIRKIEYLGHKKLPFASRGPEEGQVYKEGSHFVYHLSLPQKAPKLMRPELKLDVDVARATFYESNSTNLPEDYECTLEEELQPPFYRKSVQPLLEDKNVLANVRTMGNLSR